MPHKTVLTGSEKSAPPAQPHHPHQGLGHFSVMDPVAAAEHFRAIISSSDDAIISKTLNGTVSSWNAGAQAIFGYTADEMVGQPMLKLFPPDRMMEETLILERILDGQKVDHFATTRIHKDGRLIQVEITISPIHNSNGHIIGASKIVRDITARKALEERLNLTSSVFTHTSEAVVITDAAGVFVEVNDAFTHVTGYTRDEVLGKNAFLFRSGRQGPEVHQALLVTLRETGHCQSEIWSRRKSGEAFAGLLTVSRICDEAGLPIKHVAIFADITPLRKQQERLERMANFDPLTDLPNRLLLADRLRQALALSKRHQQTLAVVYLDLDGFKEINDRYGHDVGDELLITLAHRMQASLREVDTLARIGGDEFVAVLMDIDSMDKCRDTLERILKACREPVVINARILKVSASLGVTLFPEDDSDPDQLMRHADQAMYEAKQQGRNRYYLFDAAKDAELKTRSEIIRHIAQGFERGEFILHYQPKMNMRTGDLIGAEALIRWQHPARGLLAPADFLPLIEDHVLIETLGEWVIKTALTQLSAWKTAGLNVPLSINVSARHFQAHHFVTELARQVALHPHVKPSDLELELLETSALDNVDAVVAIMNECHRLGFQFAVDDFGTGYSSLTYLRRLPAETLKIDQSFVRDMLDDHDDLAIVKGVIGLAAAFNRKVIAEGVETIAHGTLLLALGCESGQGYGIARPMPGSALEAWISAWEPPDEWTDINRRPAN